MSDFRAIIDDLALTPGVRAVVLAADDGVVIDSVTHAGVRSEHVAAFGSALCDSAARLSQLASGAEPRMVAVEATAGRLCMARSGAVTIVILADRRSTLGRLRLALRFAMGAFA